MRTLISTSARVKVISDIPVNESTRRIVLKLTQERPYGKRICLPSVVINLFSGKVQTPVH
jgi:hypothetical protein